jgi:ComF family protein
MRLPKLILDLLDILFPRENATRELESIQAEMLIRKVPRSLEAPAGILPLFSYRNPLMRRAIWEIKYANNKKIIRLLGEAAACILALELEDEFIMNGLNGPSVLIPIPLSAKRCRERGYNQTEEVARAVIRHGGAGFFQLETSCLVKKIHTKPQTKVLTRKNRLQNIKESFGVKNPQKIRGKIIVLLDDVTTTGATLTEAAGALKASGARRVICVALAH